MYTFDYQRPTSLAEATQALQGDARVLAGCVRRHASALSGPIMPNAEE